MDKNNMKSNSIDKIKFEVGQEMGLNIKKNDEKDKKNFNKA